MKIHFITVGNPKLAYAQAGWQEYLDRLKHYHQIRLTPIPDKNNDAKHVLAAMAKTYTVAMMVEGEPFSSRKLATFLERRQLEGREVSFIIGGPEGLPPEVVEAADYQWRLSQLTFPHDLAMLITAEALYRASTINAGLPYHK